MQKENQITLKEIWAKGMEIYRATRKQTMYISVFGLFLPQLLLALYFASEGTARVEEFRQVITRGWASPSSDVFSLIQAPLSLIVMNVFFSLFVIIGFLVSYFALLYIGKSYSKGQKIPSTKEALIAGLKFTVPRGIILCMIFLLFSAVAQLIVAPMIIVAILTLMVPVVMVCEGKGVFASLGRGLLLRYARESRFGGWTVMFALMAMGAIFFASMMLVSLSGELLFRFDEWIPVSRALWTFTSSPITPVFVTVTFIESAMSALIMGVMPSITIALYFHVTAEQIEIKA